MELIKCENLTKRYGKNKALDNVSLSIESGKPIALVGPNGAGKTTLISVISGFIRSYKGDVTVCGAPPGHSSTKCRVSVLPQDASFDPSFSIGAQLTLYAKLRGTNNPDNEVQKALEQVQLQDRFKSKPTELSHGMHKRLLIAQTLLGQPEIIFLDEPTAGIDPPNAKLIRDLIATQSQHSTFVVSSHNLDELEKVCNSVIHLVDGQLVSHNNISEVAREEGYLTLLADSKAAKIIESINGVIQVKQNQHSEFIVEFDAIKHPDFHITMLQNLARNNIRYKRLINGRTLEEKMYSND